MRGLLLLAVWAAGGAVLAAEPADADKRAAKAAYDAAVLGSDLYNKGDAAGCFRVYQGALTALRPMLDHQPQLATAVAAKLDRAAKVGRPAEAAFVLREAIDAVLAETDPAAKPTAAKKDGEKPLWDRLGGEAGVRAVVREFVALAAKDPKANLDRNGNYPLTKARVEQVEQQLVEFIRTATGGPLKYTGRDMKNAHQGMKITGAEFDAAAVHLIAALKKFNVPQAEIDELVAIVGTTKKDIVDEKK
jgi:hemoglobin